MSGLASLRRLVSAPPAPERCELCAAAVPGEHEHLIDPQKRRLICACQACAILFDHSAARHYRRVPRDIRRLAALPAGDAFWNSLAIPTGLVFLMESSVTGQALALYPSPAGPTESDVDSATWAELKSFYPNSGHCARTWRRCWQTAPPVLTSIMSFPSTSVISSQD